MYDANAALRGIHADIEEGNLIGSTAVKHTIGTVIISHITWELEKKNHDSLHVALTRQALTHAASGDLNQFNEQLDKLPVKVLKDLHSISLRPTGVAGLIRAKKLKPIIKRNIDVQVKELEKALSTRPERKIVARIKELNLAQTDKAQDVPGLLHVTDGTILAIAVSKLNRLSFNQKTQLAKKLTAMVRNKNGALKEMHAYDIVDKIRSALRELPQEDYAVLKQELSTAIGNARDDVIEITNSHAVVKNAAFDSSRHLQKIIELAFTPAKVPFKFKWKQPARK